MTKEKTKEIIKLGTDEVFVLKNNTGEIKAFRGILNLSVEDGELIQPGYNTPFVISAQGYERWAEASGSSVIFPKTVIVNGETTGNPHVERDQKNNILSVTARAVAFRFSDKGIPQVSDWTTILDLDCYKLIDLLAKAKKFPQAFKLLPKNMEIKDVDSDLEGTWTPYHFDSAARLWVNTSHNEAITWYSQILNRSKKSVDYAQTFAKRNALKHLSGLQKAPGSKWQISVLCWRPTGNNIVKWDATQYSQLQDKVDSMIDDGDIELNAGTETAITENEDLEAHEAEIDPEDQGNGQVSPPEPTPAETEPPPAKSPDEPVRKAEKPPSKTASPGDPTNPMVVLKNNLLGVYENFPDEFIKVCKQKGINPENIKTIAPEKISEELAKDILEKVSLLVDKGNA